MKRRCRAIATVAILTVSLAGCAAEERTPRAFPPRPLDVAVDTLNACSMLDDAQREELGLRPGTARQVTVNGLPSAICTWTTSNGFGYNAQTVRVAADLALTEENVTQITVNGFGAARRVLQEMTGGAPTCQVTIDAAPGRAIRVQARVAPRPPLPSDEEMCRLATEAASMVMTTVVRTAR